MENFKFDINIFDITINTDKKITKKEKILLEDIENYRIKNKDKDIIYKIEEITNMIGSNEEVDSFLEKLIKKRVIINVMAKETNKEIYFISFPFFDFYIKKDNSYIFILSKALDILKKNNTFGEINILSTVLFKEKGSKQIYLEILKNKSKGTFIQEIDYFKEYIGIGTDNYERFYDFEKAVLKPIVEDINKYTDYSIQYEKIKKGAGITSKIKELKFNFYHKKFNNISLETDKIISKLVSKVDSFVAATKLIEKNIINNGFEYVKNNLEHVLEHYTAPLDAHIENALEKDLYTQYKLVNKNYILEKEITDKFSHIFIFESRIYKELLKCKFYYNYDFLKILHKLKSDEVLKYKDENFKIEAIYHSETKEGIIKIYKKDDVNNTK
ncbi:hypothetical protein [Cetobacterium sp. SF1]|uniref:hypothetical protein n=1 Tax=Cetobacterium sp. SF1 TaxID=3417654 RepID=UPI003CE6843C